MAFYDRDLALIHDAGHTAFVSSATPAVLTILREAGINTGPVLDLGCGSGVLAASLSCAGYDVTGIDVSAAMIDLARRRAPDATFICASLHDVELPPCRAALSIGECFNYLNEAPGHSLARLFRRLRAALSAGGVLVFDMALSGRGGPSGTYHANREGDGWATMSVATESDGILTRRITSFVRENDLYRRSEEVHRLTLVRPDDVLNDLAAAGFSAERLDAYADKPFPAGYGAFVART